MGGAVRALLLALLMAAPGELVARDGDLDPSFGAGGIVTTAIGVSALVVQADGKLVVAGGAGLARYNADGSLDPSFGTGGTVANPAGSASALAVQADGKLVAAGSTPSTYGSITTNFALARYNADGSLDPSFGTGGTLATPAGSASALAVQADGKLVAAGCSALNFVLARYNADGSLDPSFGTGGVTTSGFPGCPTALVVQADGKLVVTGLVVDGAFALARYNAAGSLDPSFGTGGTVKTFFPGAYSRPYALRVQADGKLAVAGDLLSLA